MRWGEGDFDKLSKLELTKAGGNACQNGLRIHDFGQIERSLICGCMLSMGTV